MRRLLAWFRALRRPSWHDLRDARIRSVEMRTTALERRQEEQRKELRGLQVRANRLSAQRDLFKRRPSS